MITVVDRMGCSTSVYENPDITQKQSQLQPIIKSSNGHIIHTNSYHNGTNGVVNKPTFKLKRAKVTPISNNHSSSNANHNHAANISTNDRVSPTLSERTDTNKSIKRVAFNDEPQLDAGPKATLTINKVSLNEPVEITSSPTDMKRARRKRERKLRKRLLTKMGEAESISERMLLESERLSLTSSMSRTTSRTASPYPMRSLDYSRDEDDNVTEVSAVSCATPREEGSRDSGQ